MFGRKKTKELSDDEYAAQILNNCRMSMGQVFQEQVAVEDIMNDASFMEGFYASEEFAEALAAYRNRVTGGK
ncbi:MAG TPA: hypothetical protein O0X25_00855 [Methanocorpusculum sp.]|nr:hypothetical protein [Methanocorpusculum sp.]HJJ39891.1 hypothetical protein [Methanocorpusculum sp.]HJJ49156.1 hypothetical protein [Methanocorpusculum sp.]HJJ56814.1 hypothetical protein [Methanocorpusculum sp.]HJJ95651.1 hypothetical protein [Methanocorpusculum sp.]